MEKTQYSKVLEDIPEVDIMITMGCHVTCPNLPCKHREDWGLDDPTGKDDIEFMKTIDKIHNNILDLSERIKNQSITISDWQVETGMKDQNTYPK